MNMTSKNYESHFDEVQLKKYIENLNFSLLIQLEICGTNISQENLKILIVFLTHSKISILALNRCRMDDSHAEMLTKLYDIDISTFDKKKKSQAIMSTSMVQIVQGSSVYTISNGYLKLLNLAWNNISTYGTSILVSKISAIPLNFGIFKVKTK
eukprot:NODE_118_length_18285_cov_1.016606.p10 type:complete len:154 gc:universal NODE_118_length_18285_cov_1.016606:10436-9975(-)